MPRATTKRTPRTRCQSCRRLAPEYDIIHSLSEEGSRDLCTRCLNTEIAAREGIAFEHPQFEPVQMADADGKPHTFHFSTHLFGPGVALEAFEVRAGYRAGYRFEVIGKPHADLMALLGKLLAKMRRGLAIKHLEDSEYGLQIADQTVRGTIQMSDRTDPWDEAEPVAVIDGREISWRLLGQMLLTFEGFQFKIEIRDLSEET